MRLRRAAIITALAMLSVLGVAGGVFIVGNVIFATAVSGALLFRPAPDYSAAEKIARKIDLTAVGAEAQRYRARSQGSFAATVDVVSVRACGTNCVQARVGLESRLRAESFRRDEDQPVDVSVWRDAESGAAVVVREAMAGDVVSDLGGNEITIHGNSLVISISAPDESVRSPT